MNLTQFIDHRRTQWQELQRLLERVEGSGLPALDPDQAVKFATLDLQRGTTGLCAIRANVPNVRALLHRGRRCGAVAWYRLDARPNRGLAE